MFCFFGNCFGVLFSLAGIASPFLTGGLRDCRLFSMVIHVDDFRLAQRKCTRENEAALTVAGVAEGRCRFALAQCARNGLMTIG